MGSYLIVAGLEQVMHFIENIRFTRKALNWLKETSGLDFSEKFLNYLENFEFKGDVYAVPEGTPVFPNEPIINVIGPSIDVQIFETYLLTNMNFQSLIATKTSRIVSAAGHRTVVDFGARRAHGRDAAICGARAAYIGEATGTSLVIVGKKWGIPYIGTMPHKFIQDRNSELQAFREYAESFPHNLILLVDTYDTLQGVRNACKVGHELRARGYNLKGVRLDSGDLLELSKESRKILDSEGFYDTKIFASSDLDEFVIQDLISKGAPIDGFGVGTKLITGANYNPITKEGGVSALDGIYKIAERLDEKGNPIPKIKISRDKITLPSRKQVYRYIKDGKYVKDIITLWDETISEAQPLLVPIMLKGELVYDFPELKEIREHCHRQLSMLPEQYKRLRGSEVYPVEISPKLSKLTEALIEKYSKITAT